MGTWERKKEPKVENREPGSLHGGVRWRRGKTRKTVVG